MPAYLSIPDGTPKGGIVVVQEAFGVTRHIEEVPERLAAVGWTALAPALFHRQGSPVMAYDDFAAVMPVMQTLTRQGISTDVGAVFDYLRGLGFEAAQTGVVGFCMGGSVTFFTAVERSIGAAVTFYGGGVAEGRFGYPPQLELAPKLQTPWLGLYGDLDKSIPVDQVEQLRGAVAASGVATEVVRYAEAEHGFNCNDRPNNFNQEAATDGWARMLAWFSEHIGAS
jgi:carboxymethylenebutenolidase